MEPVDECQGAAYRQDGREAEHGGRDPARQAEHKAAGCHELDVAPAHAAAGDGGEQERQAGEDAEEVPQGSGKQRRQGDGPVQQIRDFPLTQITDRRGEQQGGKNDRLHGGQITRHS